MTEEMSCYKHPDRKTYLRCNQCGRPICSDCAVKVPTGYRCRECVKEQQKRFDTSLNKDYLIGGLIAFVIGLLGSYVSGMIPYLPVWISALVFGVLLGRAVCALVRKAVNKRRSRTLSIVVTAAAGIGALLPRLQSIRLNLLFMGVGPVWMTNGLLQIFLDLLFVIVLCGSIWMEMNQIIFKG